MKKQLITKIVSIAVALALGVTVMAAYLTNRATMSLFSGRVEDYGSTGGDSRLFLKVDGVDVGQDGSVSGNAQAAFPFLTGEVTRDVSTELWTDENGRSPIVAPTFVLAAEGGDFENVALEIFMTGDMVTASALRFGVTTKRHFKTGNTITTTEVMSIETMGVGESGYVAQTWKSHHGDGCLLEGEEIEVSIVAWVDPDAFFSPTNAERNNGLTNVEVVFSGDPIAQS